MRWSQKYFLKNKKILFWCISAWQILWKVTTSPQLYSQTQGNSSNKNDTKEFDFYLFKNSNDFGDNDLINIHSMV
jgi:hypothetical protein